MKKTLIIPDVHMRLSMVENILLKEESFDKCIFLGDLFDSHIQELDNIKNTFLVARWIKNKLENDNRFIFLFGNHDISYACNAKGTKWYGWSKGKQEAINKSLSREHWERWKFFWISEGWFLSHAGLNKKFLPPMWKAEDVNNKNIKEWLLIQSQECLEMLNNPYGNHWFIEPGDERCYPPQGRIGGLLWQGANEEFSPIKGISQIFGHTYHDYPLIISGEDYLPIRICNGDILSKEYKPFTGDNICLDTGSQYYGVINDGLLKIKKYE